MSSPHSLRMDLFACPACHADLRANGDELMCGSCHQRFPLSDGIPCFSPSEGFYDSYAEEHCPFHLSPSGLKGAVLRALPFWSWREWRFWRQAIPSCHRLLDIGCGSGRQLFTERAEEPIGYDGGLQFARNCAKHYHATAVGQLPKLPFRSGIFDVVVSSHVIGHVALEQKDALISEISRVLRPGGITAHIIETDSEHPIIVAAKQDPETYRKQFIEQDGHIGLEKASRIIERFEKQGFKVTNLRLVDAILPSMQNYRKYLDHPKLSQIPGMARLRQINHWQTHSAIANACYEIGMGLFHQTIEQWMGRPDRAQFILVGFVKIAPDGKGQR